MLGLCIYPKVPYTPVLVHKGWRVCDPISLCVNSKPTVAEDNNGRDGEHVVGLTLITASCRISSTGRVMVVLWACISADLMLNIGPEAPTQAGGIGH